MNRSVPVLLVWTIGLAVTTAPGRAEDVIASARERFAAADVEEVPDFQRHVLPAMGRLGCNTRACHGSFQGQGGFRLSLFGYDFKADHDALMAKDENRVDPEAPELSEILQKPSEAIPHKGGKRMTEGDWAYNLLHRWIEAGAKPADGTSVFDHIEVSPAEISFQKDGETVPLRVVACWADGSREDVTVLTRFQTNDESIATIDADGVVTSKAAGDTHVVAFYDNGVHAVPVLRPVSDKVGPNYPDVPTPTEIDRLVVEKLRKLGIVPSPVCTDTEFLRRLSVDLTGSLPTPQEVEAFLNSDDPDKRSKKVDELLERPTYAAWWANKLCDILGNSPRNFQGMTGAPETARNWFRWIERRVGENQPYDELVAGMVLGVARSPEESYEEFMKRESAYFRTKDPADYSQRESTPYFWARRNLRQPEEKALAFSYAFLGVRLECAQCHKHPFDQWTQDDFNRFKAFFEPIRYGLGPDGNKLAREIREEIEQARSKDGDKKPINGGMVRNEIEKRVRQGQPVPLEELLIARPRTRPDRPGSAKDRNRVRGSARVPTASVLGGDTLDLSQFDDPRKPIMEWMRDPENPYFARAFVNRVWAAYFGPGIINPPDDSNLANPPSNEALLAYLTREFVARDFDMKWLHRTIVASDTYQRSWQVNETNRHDDRNYSHAIVRRMPAEALIDAVRQATASSPLLAKMVADPSLRTFGAEGTASYGRGGADYAGRVFGRSVRDTNCDCSRSDEPNLLQAIYLQNDNDVHNAIERSDGWVAEWQKAARDRSPDGATGNSTSAIEARIAALESRIRQVGDRNKNAERLERLEAQLRTERAALNKTKAASKSATPSDPVVAEGLIREAFLRTVNRPPTPAEVTSAVDHFEAAENTPQALRDLLWALVNTKEFITNH